MPLSREKTVSRWPLASRLLVALCVVLLGLELVLQFVPGLVPRPYRETFAANGLGFERPELLEETPVRALPLPLSVQTYTGPPPSDLVGYLGVAPDTARAIDAARWPEVHLPIDARGLPNPTVPARADVLLVGDSFAVAAGCTQPVSLQALLEREFGLDVYNLGVTGTGPLQQRWILRTEGLPKSPRVVVWLFFGGNDLTDTSGTLQLERQGLVTWGDRFADGLRPRWILPDLVGYLFEREVRAEAESPAEPFAFPASDGSTVPMWFAPKYLMGLTFPRAKIERLPAWSSILEALEGARDECDAAGARFLCVYVPSKAQVHLPLVEPNAALAFRTANADFDSPLYTEATLLPAALEHRGVLETLVREACEERAIPFVSATPALEGLARSGTLGYLTADTHWSPDGQAAFLPELAAAIEELFAAD